MQSCKEVPNVLLSAPGGGGGQEVQCSFQLRKRQRHLEFSGDKLESLEGDESLPRNYFHSAPWSCLLSMAGTSHEEGPTRIYLEGHPSQNGSRAGKIIPNVLLDALRRFDHNIIYS